MPQICNPIKVSYVPDCISCHKTTQEAVPYDFNTSSPLQYVTFPINPNAGDLHIVLFRDYTSYYKYTGTEWNNEGYKIGITDSGELEWDDILNKPTTFTPAPHTHPISGVVNLQSTLTGLQNDLTVAEGDIVDLQANKAEVIHTHVIGDITGLQQELDDINTAISLTGDNWGTQVVEHDSTLTGTGVIGNLLSLADGAVTETKIQNGAVTTLKVVDGAITNPKIVDSAVTTPKISNNAVTDIKIANNAVTTNKIANNAVTIDKLPAGGSSTTFLNGAGAWAAPSLSYVSQVYAGAYFNSGTIGPYISILSVSLTPGVWLFSSSVAITHNGDVRTNVRISFNSTPLVTSYVATRANATSSVSISQPISVSSTANLELLVQYFNNEYTVLGDVTYITAIKLS